MQENTERKEEIIKVYLSLVEEQKRLPSKADFLSQDISDKAIRHSFGNITNLHSLIEEEYSDNLANHIAHESHIFNSKRIKDMTDELKNYKRFFVTSVVNNKLVDNNFLRSIKSYCEKNNAFLILIPCADVASTKTKIGKWTFDKEIANEFFVTEEFKLNENIFISNIKISAKQILPTTGLARIGQRDGSYIFASPKQSLEYVATSPEKTKMSKALMSTGCLTLPNYDNERYMSGRTSYIAESDHIMGGIVVEIENDKIFHFRQIQSNIKGEFIDLGKKYKPDGKVSEVTTDLYAGDWHSGQTDYNVMKGLETLTFDIPIRNVYIGDFFDGYSISHHHINVPLKRVGKVMEGKESLELEIQKNINDINWWHSLIDGKIYLIKGNHDEVLEKYLMNANYVKDDNNHYYSLDLAKSLLDKKDPLKEAYEKSGISYNKKRVVWLQRDDSLKISGVEVGQHGDLGSNGSRGSLQSMEKAYGNCIVGHSHSAAILRGVFRVGTFTKLKMDYNKGPSSWTHTGCLIYEDGSRQLINFINDKYTIE